MAGTGKIATSFDDIIQADRQKRKAQKLATEIFGQKGRRSSAPGAGGILSRKTASIPSLASRVGISKQRSVSAAAAKLPKAKANVNGQWTHDLHALNNPKASRVSQLPARAASLRVARDNRLYAALQSESVLNGTDPQINVRGASKGLSIRGVAGPFALRADNFAPGTTAEDIRAAMEPQGGEIITCRLLSARPTVMAEIVFAEKAGAEAIISIFNNQKADGRVLHVYMKDGPPLGGGRSASARAVPAATRGQPVDTDDAQGGRGFGERRLADVEIEDGRYGFEANSRIRDRDDRGLYSDTIVSSRGQRGRR